MMTLFEIATRENYRFESSKGLLSISDLWRLPLLNKHGPSLQSVAVAINRSIQGSGEEMFVHTEQASPELKTLRTKLEVVKRIIEVREAEALLAKVKNTRLQEKQVLLEVLEKKEVEALSALSAEEIKARIESIED